MANNKMFSDDEHRKHVENLSLHLTTAVKLEEHLMAQINNNGCSVDGLELAQRIFDFERSVKFEPIIIHDLFRNSRRCPRHGETKNNVSELFGNIWLCTHVRCSAPPDSIVRVIQCFNERMFKEHLPLLRGDKHNGSLPTLMKIGQDHHNKQLDSADVGNLNLGKENKGKPFIQFAVTSVNHDHASPPLTIAPLLMLNLSRILCMPTQLPKKCVLTKLPKTAKT